MEIRLDSQTIRNSDRKYQQVDKLYRSSAQRPAADEEWKAQKRRGAVAAALRNCALELREESCTKAPKATGTIVTFHKAELISQKINKNACILEKCISFRVLESILGDLMSHCLKDNSIQFGNVINVICHGQDEPSASDPKAFALLLVPCSWAEELQNVAEEVEAAIGGLA